jgi:putative hemolysin
MSDLRQASDAGPAAIGLDLNRHPHIVDQLIAERGQKIVASRHWPLIKPFLYKILHYREAVRMADELAPLPGAAAMDYCSRLLSLDLDIDGLDNVPRQGSFILAANHPTGIADGVAVYDALRRARLDIAIFTNRDAIRINPRLADFLIPVEWREDLRDRTKMKETLRLSSRAFSEGRAVVIFPSGRIAFWGNGRLNERPWMTSAVTLARKQGVPVLPVNVQARNSSLFYWFANSGFIELRDMTVFHELLNKRGKTFRIRFGALISKERIAEGDPAEVTKRLQEHTVERIAQDIGAVF